MIWFWFISAVLSVGVVRILLWSVLRRRGAVDKQTDDVALYREQLQTLDTELNLGLITLHEAEGHRYDIGRRLLDIIQPSKKRSRKIPAASGSGSPILIGSVVLVPLLALVLYLLFGRPDLPSHPYQSLSIDITNQDPTLLREFAQTSIQNNNGLVSFDVQRALEELLKHNPYDPQARFFLALARAQQGDLQGAMIRWVCLIETSTAEAPWLPAVREHLTHIAQQLGKAPEDVIPMPFVSPIVEESQRVHQEQNTDSANLPSPECRTLVLSITTTLEAHLITQPHDVDRWLMLAQSYHLLGQLQRYQHALRQVLGYLPPESSTYQRITTRLEQLEAR